MYFAFPWESLVTKLEGRTLISHLIDKTKNTDETAVISYLIDRGAEFGGDARYPGLFDLTRRLSLMAKIEEYAECGYPYFFLKYL